MTQGAQGWSCLSTRGAKVGEVGGKLHVCDEVQVQVEARRERLRVFCQGDVPLLLGSGDRGERGARMRMGVYKYKRTVSCRAEECGRAGKSRWRAE